MDNKGLKYIIIFSLLLILIGLSTTTVGAAELNNSDISSVDSSEITSVYNHNINEVNDDSLNEADENTTLLDNENNIAEDSNKNIIKENNQKTVLEADENTYVTDVDPSSIDYENGTKTSIHITATYDSSYRNYISGTYWYVYVNGATTGIQAKSYMSSFNFYYNSVSGDSTSFYFDVSTVADKLNPGINTLTFHPDEGTLSIFDSTTFNPLTVNFKTATNDTPVNNTTVATYDYETSVSPDTVDYVNGTSSNVTVTAVYETSEDLSDMSSMKVYINNDTSGIVISGVDAMSKSFVFDLASIADRLVVGSNTLTFHPNQAFLEGNAYFNTFNYNPLTVNFEAAKIPVNYITTPTPNNVDYLNGTSSNITVTADYDSTYSDDLSYGSMFVYINGETTADRVAVSGIDGSATSFVFDLASIADRLVVGTNTLTFHPNPGLLEGATTWDNMIFNPLTVNFEAGSSSYDYETFVSPDTVDYVNGTSSNVTVTAVYETSEDLSDMSSMKVYINNDTSGIVISGVDAMSKSFVFDLASIADRLVVGSNTLTFHPNQAFLEGNAYFNTFNYNPLTVNVEDNTLSYVTTPTPNTVDYTNGSSSIINVTADYNSDYENYLEYGNMFVYINGENTANRVKIEGLKGSEKTFTFDLATIADKLNIGTNTLTFHPDPSVFTNTIKWDITTFNPLTVNIKAPNNYITTPTPNSVDYINGTSSNVTVTVTYDSVYSEDLSYGSMYVYINGETTDDRVAVSGIDGSAVSFVFDLASIADRLVVGSNTLTFHPNPGLLEGAATWDSMVFNPLTVNFRAPNNYVTTPVPDSVDYINGTSSNVTVTADYNSDYADDLSYGSMYVYINGETTDDRIAVSGIDGSAVSFVFDLASIADRLVVGSNTLTFHPNPGLLEGAATWDSMVFNPLTVNFKETPKTNTSIVYDIDDNADITVKLLDINNNPISNASITYNINNGDNQTVTTDNNGNIIISNLTGENTLNVYYSGDNTYAPSSKSQTIVIINRIHERINTTIDSHDFNQTAVDFYNGERGTYFIITLRDINGNALAGKDVKIGFNGAVYNRTTDEKGSAQLQINLRYAGDYTFATSFLGDDDYAGTFAINKISISKKVSRIVLTGTNALKPNTYRTLTVSLQGTKALNTKQYVTAVNKTVKVTVNGKTYNVRIGANGKGTLRVRFTSTGTYTITTKFAGDGTYSAKTSTSKITVRR